MGGGRRPPVGAGEFDIDSLQAAEREPLLRGHPGNARRQASLERLRGALRPKKGGGHSRNSEFAELMGPDSTPGAWEALSRRLEGADPTLASLAASEHAIARADVWGAMRAGADMVPHLDTVCRRLEEKRHGALGEMREELYSALSYVGDSVRPGPEVRAYIANLARFGSGADDEMTGRLVNELYVRRDLLEGACDICEEILRFEGADHDRMAGSTLVEDILLMVLGGLEDRGKKNSDLAKRCGRLLQKRSDMLRLGTEPDPGENNALRALSRFAADISARRRTRTAGELGLHIERLYPLSHGFLGLDRAGNLEDMAGGGSQLAANMSAYVSLQEIAAAQRLPPGGSNALMVLEPMIEHLERAAPRKSVLDKWRKGIRGKQLWESLFEMEMYLRIFMTDARVEVDKKVGKKKSGKKEHRKKVDLAFNGCYAEIYSPLEGEVLVPGRAVTVEDPGKDFMERVLSKAQLEALGGLEAVLVVECPPGEYTNVEMLGKKMWDRLERPGQPGGIFFVRRDGSARRRYAYLENPCAAVPVSKRAIGTMRRALELEFPPTEPRGRGG